MNRQSLLTAALSYFGLVFATGFALGVVRVLWLVPRLGVRAAELAEAPVMLLVSFLAARYIGRRFALPASARARLWVGAIALGCLLTVEFTVVIWLQGISLRESFANRDPVSGTVYLANLLAFALMPLLVGRAPIGAR